MKTLLIRTLLTITLVAGLAAGSASASDGSGSHAVTQTLELSEGWNLVALTVRPVDAKLTSMLEPVLGEIVLVRDHEGRTVVPRLQIDEIGEWDVRTAYEIFARGDVSLTLSGTPLEDEDLTFELVAGWNAVPFVGRTPIPVSDMFGNGVVLVQDSKGRIYWPENEIDDIGELVPGTGYQVFVLDAVAARLPQKHDTYRVPDFIDPTGASDVTTDLAEFVASVPDGSIIEFRPQAKYRVDGTLRLVDRHNIVIDGKGALIFTDIPRPDPYSGRGNYPWRNRYHLSLEGGSNITVRNLRIKGAHPEGGTGDGAYQISLEAQHGINIYSTKTVRIENCEISDVYGDFIYIGYQRGGWAEDIQVISNRMERNGRQGIAVTGGRDIIIEENYIGDVRRSVFDLEANSNTGGAINVTIKGNHIGPKRLTWLANQGKGSNIRNIVVDSNYSETEMNFQVRTPEGHRRGPFKIVNNTATRRYGSPSGALMIFDRVDGLVITGNDHPLQINRNMYGARLNDVTDFVIEDNDLPNGVGQYFIVEN